MFPFVVPTLFKNIDDLTFFKGRDSMNKSHGKLKTIIYELEKLMVNNIENGRVCIEKGISTYITINKKHEMERET